MSRRSKFLIVAGARPNFMKVAPLIAVMRGRREKGLPVDYRLVHTGQHYDRAMSEVFFGELGIPAPDINLGVGSGTHAVQTANVMIRFEQVCQREKPDWVIVVGDVNSTLACTLVCAKLGVKVAHVEAGLRSFDRGMPEEINRIVTDSLADLLLTPSRDADENLKREGLAEDKIHLVGNVMIDALVCNLDQARRSSILVHTDVRSRKFAYVTLHRPSNVDDRNTLESIVNGLKCLSERVPVVFPMHPRTRKMCEQFKIDLDGHSQFKVIGPIGYHDSICLTENARLVLTDSGGLQEETTYFRTPCLTLRPSTERPITVTMGSNQLTSPNRLMSDIQRVLDRPSRLGVVPPLWDGSAADRIVDALVAAQGN